MARIGIVPANLRYFGEAGIPRFVGSGYDPEPYYGASLYVPRPRIRKLPRRPASTIKRERREMIEALYLAARKAKGATA